MNIYICGYGNMGSALAKALNPLAAQQKYKIICYDADPAKRTQAAAAQFPTTTFENEVFASENSYFLCMKPQNITEFASSFAKFCDRSQNNLIVSILAGVSLATLSQLLAEKTNSPGKEDVKIARVMPNIGALVGKGAGAVAYHTAVTADEKKQIQSLLDKLGFFIELAEQHMDAVTALSGSGPAFVLTAIETLIDAGVYLGLKRNDAQALVTATFAGTAELMQKKSPAPPHPASLKAHVTSPGGTTIHGLQALEAATNFRQALWNATLAAHHRSVKLKKIAARQAK